MLDVVDVDEYSAGAAEVKACLARKKLESITSLIYHSEIGVLTVFKDEVLVRRTRKVLLMNQASLSSPWIIWAW